MKITMENNAQTNTPQSANSCSCVGDGTNVTTTYSAVMTETKTKTIDTYKITKKGKEKLVKRKRITTTTCPYYPYYGTGITYTNNPPVVTTTTGDVAFNATGQSK